MDDLSPLQRRLLAVLADVEPAWTLTGGAALVGFYLHHRALRDAPAKDGGFSGPTVAWLLRQFPLGAEDADLRPFRDELIRRALA